LLAAEEDVEHLRDEKDGSAIMAIDEKFLSPQLAPLLNSLVMTRKA